MEIASGNGRILPNAFSSSRNEPGFLWERPFGTHCHPERPFPFFQWPAKRLRGYKAVSGSFGVIRVIVSPTGRLRDHA
jgi:hypothetical protein